MYEWVEAKWATLSSPPYVIWLRMEQRRAVYWWIKIEKEKKKTRRGEIKQELDLIIRVLSALILCTLSFFTWNWACLSVKTISIYWRFFVSKTIFSALVLNVYIFCSCLSLPFAKQCYILLIFNSWAFPNSQSAPFHACLSCSSFSSQHHWQPSLIPF